uniref:Anti-lipopolysaccharide factor n=1 Tax=Neocaridina davidi TaxID=1592667 RepID=A0A3G3CBB3_9EUCA|nr:anti-lipopolysaccharide factor [Neocaridina davidi]
MRATFIVSVILMGLIVAPLVPTCEAQGWEALAIAVGEKLVGLWNLGNLEFMGRSCEYSVKPTIRRFELYFKGRMWCPGWTPIRGEAMTRSRSGVVGLTTRDFARKAFESGLITEEQAQTWLNSK